MIFNIVICELQFVRVLSPFYCTHLSCFLEVLVQFLSNEAFWETSRKRLTSHVSLSVFRRRRRRRLRPDESIQADLRQRVVRRAGR